MPPGTGDVALSLSQTVPVAGAVLVTTPQAVSLADTRRAVQMYRKLNIPALGLDREHEPLRVPGLRTRKRHLRQGRRRGAGGRDDACRFSAACRSTSRCGAAATPACRSSSASRDSPPARALVAAAERVAQQVSIASFSRRAIPLTPSSSSDAPVRVHERSRSPKHTLANGLDVIVHEDHRVPLVAVSVWYHVGSKNERPGLTGLAHLFEHLMFEGSEHQPRTVLRAAAGGRRARSTARRAPIAPTTGSWCRPDALRLALWMEADRMGWLLPALTEARFETQRGVVLNERRQNYENRPYGLAQFALMAAHVSARSPVSLADDRLGRRSARGDHWTTSARFSPVLPPGQRVARRSPAMSTRRDAFAGRGAVRRDSGRSQCGARSPRRRSRRAGSRIVLEDRVELPRLYLAWPSPPLFGPGDAELDLVGDLLANGARRALSRG